MGVNWLTVTVPIPRKIADVMKLFIEAGIVKGEGEFIKISAMEYVRSIIRRYRSLCSSLERRYGSFDDLEKGLLKEGFGDTLEEHRKYDDYKTWKELRGAIEEYEGICSRLEKS
jgi:hypothetical protein